MTTKERIKMLGLIFAAALMVTLAGIRVSVTLNHDVAPIAQSEPSPSVAITKASTMDVPVVLLPPSATSSPMVASTPEPESFVEECPNPYAGITLTDQEREWLCRMAYSEAGNQEFDGQVAVVQAALNRLMHEKFPGDVRSVLFQPNQFCVGDTYTETQEEAVKAALMGRPALDLNTDVVFFSTGSLRYGSYYKTIGAHVFRTYS